MMAQVWGWEAFFGQVQSFLSHLDMSNSSQNYLQHCLERLEMIISSTAAIKRTLDDGMLSRSGLTAQQVSILRQYKGLLDS